ncbi:hypothetical protein [Microbacterium stercoris]|uniref:Uncharacterized protein n=1 Tax=Microbacterium stercoris TaxID=2820289 RepID=A0A939QMF2_9MICO|nr:hypothetical protein [Microbacterium stercoris]MBO3662415.1 hypothetical protein [Microbacterium stercoris]MBO3664407.1 hypothetical protein [Microbacterium stercoris]
MTEKTPLGTRIREAGGLYLWLNKTLIRLAGPPQVSPNLPRNRDGDACAHCGLRRDAHREDADGTLHCPSA